MRTAKEAVLHSGPSLVKFKNDHGDQYAKAFITSIVVDLVTSFNIGKTMNESQVVDCVEILQTDYYFLKPSELKYCFKNAKAGRYGKTYDRIDSSIIFEWIEKYLDERMSVVITEKENENKQYKSSELNPIFEKILKKVSEDYDKTIKENTAPIQREKTEFEIFSQEVFREFDRMYLEKPIDSNEIMRTIPHNGKNLTQDEYFILRMNEYNKLKSEGI